MAAVSDSSSTPHDTKSQHLVAAESHSVPAADSLTILNKLMKHKFPKHKWVDLAVGLMLADHVPGIKSENGTDLSRLIDLVTRWTAKVDESGRWETLVDAVNMCGEGEYSVAKNLAKDVCVPPPPPPPEGSRPVTSGSGLVTQPVRKTEFVRSSSLTSERADSASLKADSNTILYQLMIHKFPERKWSVLATGLKLGGRVDELSEKSSNHLRLIALVNHWTAYVDESGRWKTLVDAVNMCGEYSVAKNLAEDVHVRPPRPPE